MYDLACSGHLTWGYVDHPPLSIVLLWISRHLFGDSLVAVRLLPALSGGFVVILAAMLARRLGGGRTAQAISSGRALPGHTWRVRRRCSSLEGRGRRWSGPIEVVLAGVTKSAYGMPHEDGVRIRICRGRRNNLPADWGQLNVFN